MSLPEPRSLFALRPPENPFRLDGAVVLITGSTRGIGLAMAQAFARAGARVAVSSEDPEDCARVAADMAAEGFEVLAAPCDVADAGQLADLVDRVSEGLGPIDVLVCNAGVAGPVGPLGAVDDQTFDDTFAINLKHPWRLTSLVAPGMARRGGGAIVLTASIAGLRGNKAIGLYGLTKAALAQLARNLAVEWGPSGVRVNALAPGLTATAWTAAVLSDPVATERRLGLTPLRRVGQPWEIAAAAVFLASPAAGFITGHTLVADGGTVISDGN